MLNIIGGICISIALIVLFILIMLLDIKVKEHKKTIIKTLCLLDILTDAVVTKSRTIDTKLNVLKERLFDIINNSPELKKKLNDIVIERMKSDLEKFKEDYNTSKSPKTKPKPNTNSDTNPSES